MALREKNSTVDKFSKALAGREGIKQEDSSLEVGISQDSILQAENKVMLGIRLTPYEKKQLQVIAERQKRTLSQLCRIVLIDYVSKQG
jgi:hypothetical protein